MNNKEEIHKALANLRTAQDILARIDGGDNEHLLGYASEGIETALGYLGTFERRLDDPESD